jgi:hypothetical protein
MENVLNYVIYNPEKGWLDAYGAWAAHWIEAQCFSSRDSANVVLETCPGAYVLAVMGAA